jgi:general stress protein 26
MEAGWQPALLGMRREDLFGFMRGHLLAVVSSIGPRGGPQSALMGIAVTDELEIVFDTVRSSRKYANLQANPAAAFVIGWTGERTLQYEGVAEELGGEELRRCQEVYFAVWPDGEERKNGPDICYFLVKPQWIRFSDYGQSPPFIEEFQFTA